MKISRRLLTTTTALLSILPTLIGNTQAQQPDENRFRLSVGAFIMDFDTSVRVDTPSGRGATIDLEDDLGMDSDQTQLVVSARYRFARKHSLGLGYLTIDRDSQRTLSRDIQFRDDLFTVGLDVQSFFEFDVLELGYRYALVQKPRFAFVLSVGISAIDYDLGLRADLQPGPGSLEGRDDEAYPIPTFGLGVSYQFAPKWSFRSGFQYFEYSADDWEANLLLLDVDLEYFPWKNVGFGLGYNYLEIGYEESGGDALDIIYEYDGILLRALFEF